MRSLALKLTLAFLVISLSGIGLVAIFAVRATADEFGHFVANQNRDALAAQLEDYYRTFNSWEGVDTLASPGGMGGAGMGMGPMHAQMMGGGFAVADAAGRVVAAGVGHRQGERLSAAEIARGTPLRLDGQLVGTLIAGQDALGMMSPAGTAFLAGVNRALVLGAVGAAVAALVLGVALAGALTRPLRELTAAAREIARGKLEQKVPVRSHDELGELAGAFNQMSADLARARDLRRQMTADIAHDLRTPLSVILGHAEALRDGVLPTTPETFSLIHAEAQHLNRLVEDLRTLSLAESGEIALTCRPTQPGALLEHAVAAQAPRAHQQNVTLRTEIEPDAPEVDVDPDRMAQVLDNLLDNALRHTPAGGVISVHLSVTRRPSPVAGRQSHARSPDAKLTTDDWLRITVKDTGSGIAAEDLPRIFDRFYRADKSRARSFASAQESGSGLGLAIAKSIVEAHGGRIWAESQPGAGAQFFIELPTAKS
jgi:signal transduction histidine kinase